MHPDQHDTPSVAPTLVERAGFVSVHGQHPGRPPQVEDDKVVFERFSYEPNISQG